MRLRRQLAGTLHFAQHFEQAFIRHQHAFDAVLAGASHVLHRLHQLIGAPHLGGDDAARRGVGHRAGVPTGTRPDEETDLDTSLRGDLPHLIQLIVGQQHDAAALTDPVYWHPQLIGALEDGA